MYTYAAQTRASVDVSQDFVFRLGMVVLAMSVPFVVACSLHSPTGVKVLLVVLRRPG